MVIFRPMSAPPPTTPTTPPDRHQDGVGAVAAAPSRTARLLGLVRMLMDYGFELVCTLQRRAAANDVSVSAMTRPFGTRNFALILARITRGLRLAGALEERLMRRPVTEEKKPASTSAPSPRQPRAARPAAARPAARRLEDPDPRLALLPTSEQIAADIRRRPVGAVIADICRDLGILPGHKLWRELSLAIIDHGGSLVRLSEDIFKRLRLARAILQDDLDRASPAPGPQFSPVGGTGPP
jgi:hypothetical protein